MPQLMCVFVCVCVCICVLMLRTCEPGHNTAHYSLWRVVISVWTWWPCLELKKKNNTAMWSESMLLLWCKEEILWQNYEQFRSLASEGRPHLYLPATTCIQFPMPLHSWSSSLLSCNCSSVLGNSGRKSQSFRPTTMTIKKRWRKEEESVSAEMKEGGRLRSRREVEECWLRSAKRGGGREGEKERAGEEGWCWWW